MSMIPKSVKRFLVFAKLASASEGASEKIMLNDKLQPQTENPASRPGTSGRPSVAF